jgi:hypothetical protein
MTEDTTERHSSEEIKIQIDRVHYEVRQGTMTGSQIRAIPTPPIGVDRDLFEVVPGHADRKILDNEQVELRNGTRFFTAPSTINPGSMSD